ncbi:hypothetical protein K450DRAFT_109896 [Umbelopsis ramanniana AG]|uniref:Uncharacterized protein n=1 Tax=Umbelopsis ramanniana AG TaxID=1314678 RepID=A0AAD5E7P8_UMBRA|nr:uncharacterized protein K450DRAFT_109896 [Umbelopsis ramanniana AG]KAI8577135.1 hypothetical protein K450DRAFT_109896 [Umbelopsis ramanniana AG]
MPIIQLGPMVHDDFEDTELRPKRESLPQPYIIHELPQPRLQVDASSSALTEENTTPSGIVDAEELDIQIIPTIETEDLVTPLVDIDKVESSSLSPLPVRNSFIEQSSALSAEEVDQTDIQEEMEAVNDSVPSGTTDQLIVDVTETLVMTPHTNNEAVLEVSETPTPSVSPIDDKEDKTVMDNSSEAVQVTEENQLAGTAPTVAQTVDISSDVKADTANISSESQNLQNNPQRPTHARRTSVAQVAQSYLGDKLEDLTEKLTFIKKNIIMSLEEDEDEEDEFAASTYTPRPSKSQQMRPRPMPKPHSTTSETPVSQRPQRNSSLPKSMTSQKPQQDYPQSPQTPRPSVERFNSFQEEASASFSRIFSKITSTNDRPSFSPSSFFAALAGTEEETGPSSPLPPQSPAPSSEIRTAPTRTSSRGYVDQQKMDVRNAEQRAQALRRPGARNSINMFEEGQADQEGEVVFDFGKVLEMGRTFGKSLGGDVVQNGLKVFNDVSDRMKKRRGSGEDNWLGRDSWL